MRNMEDLNPNSVSRMVIGSLCEWPAAIPFLPFIAAIVWMTCSLH